jgi:hypothetical protein
MRDLVYLSLQLNAKTLLEKQFILEKDYKKSLLLQQKQKMTLED